MSQEIVRLSASRIKTLQSCSWTYYANYVLKLPQTNNSGAMRGTICHLIFELLSNPRHAKYVKTIVKKKSCLKIKSIKRLILKHANKMGLDLTEIVKPLKKEAEITNLECIDAMILVGVNYDFLHKKAKQEFISSEWAFDITSESPRYRVVGFVDRLVHCKEEDALIIRDYKSSKKTFAAAELESNLQSMIYSVAAKKHFPHFKKVKAKFLFLRYPDAPEQQSPEFTDEELLGFEHYLEYISNLLSNFDETKAKANFAKNDFGKKWMCQTKSGWRCPYLEAIDYKVLLDENGKTIKSIFNTEEFKPEELKENYSVEVRHYDGCPAWKQNNDKKDFGF